MKITAEHEIGDVVYVLKGTIFKCTVLGIRTETDENGTEVLYNVRFHGSSGSTWMFSDHVYGSVEELISYLKNNIQ